MRVVVCIAALSMMSSGLRAQTPDTIINPARVLAGSALFNGGTCIGCHAVGGRGQGNRAPNLSDTEWLHSQGDFAGILNTIFWGVPRDKIKAVTPRPSEMHPRGSMDVSYDQLKSIAAYVWALSRPETNAYIADQRKFIDLVRFGQVAEAVKIFRAPHPASLLHDDALEVLAEEIKSTDPTGAAAILKLRGVSQ